ncbi:hypothetical protein DFH11DRAFT_1541896 [Phellopilus nigrolimitatus]|nr:hypothetical protein DFH11DRAFT_1541896 [Phellopilus nigrolimitatus]
MYPCTCGPGLLEEASLYGQSFISRNRLLAFCVLLSRILRTMLAIAERSEEFLSLSYRPYHSLNGLRLLEEYETRAMSEWAPIFAVLDASTLRRGIRHWYWEETTVWLIAKGDSFHKLTWCSRVESTQPCTYSATTQLTVFRRSLSSHFLSGLRTSGEARVPRSIIVPRGWGDTRTSSLIRRRFVAQRMSGGGIFSSHAEGLMDTFDKES